MKINDEFFTKLRIPNGTTLPTVPTPEAGWVFYDTDDRAFCINDGVTWEKMVFGAAGQTYTFPATGGTVVLEQVATAAETWIGPSATTGWYFKAGNVSFGDVPTTKFQIFRSAGLSYLSVDAAGARNVVIGNTSLIPSGSNALLSLLGSNGYYAIKMASPNVGAALYISNNAVGATNQGFYFGTTTNHYFGLATQDTIRMVIDGTGLIGFGSLFTGAGVTYQRLNINGNLLFVGADSSQESPMFQIVPSYVVNTHASYTARTVFSQWKAAGAQTILTFDTSTTYGALFSLPLKTTGRQRATRTVTGNDTLTSADETIVCNSATAMTETIITATGSGTIFTISNINTGDVTVSKAGDTINGEASQIVSQWSSMAIQDVAANTWIII